MDEIICPQCGGPGNLLGVLGKYANFRCRDCGSVFRDENLPVPEGDDDDNDDE